MAIAHHGLNRGIFSPSQKSSSKRTRFIAKNKKKQSSMSSYLRGIWRSRARRRIWLARCERWIGAFEVKAGRQTSWVHSYSTHSTRPLWRSHSSQRLTLRLSSARCERNIFGSWFYYLYIFWKSRIRNLLDRLYLSLWFDLGLGSSNCVLTTPCYLGMSPHTFHRHMILLCFDSSWLWFLVEWPFDSFDS